MSSKSNLLVNKETTCARGYVKVFIFKRDRVQIHEIAVHFSKAWRRIPAGGRQNLRTKT